MNLIVDNKRNIPSNQIGLLKNMIGFNVNSLIRCSWDSFENYDKDKIYGIAQCNFFRFTSGSLIFIMDNGYEIGFSSLEDISSVIIWEEKDPSGRKKEDYFREDTDIILIDSLDERYTTERVRLLNNRSVSAVKILKRIPRNAKYESLANEVGVQLEFDNGEILVIAHNLINSPDSFSLAFKDEISEDVIAELSEIIVS